MPERVSLGDGQVQLADLGQVGSGCVLEAGVKVFCPQGLFLGNDVYVGHDSFLRAYPKGLLTIGDGCWIGPGCFINSFGGVTLGRRVGLGPGVKIISSSHSGQAGGGLNEAIIDTALQAGPVLIEDGADIGVAAVILPGVIIGRSAQVGAGAVVTRSVRPNAVVVGVPARPIFRSNTEMTDEGDSG